MNALKSLGISHITTNNFIVILDLFCEIPECGLFVEDSSLLIFSVYVSLVKYSNLCTGPHYVFLY